MVKPSPRRQLGPARTEAARKALGVAVDGFVADGLVIDTDPLGRGVDYLTITRDGKALGELTHRPGGYGENAGDWHVTLIRKISMKAYDIQHKRERFPNLAWSYDSGPHNTPETALSQFSRKVAEGVRLCPEAFE